MRVILSRKGFDTGSGGVPSPIIGGKPVSLPIPATHSSVTTYADLGLGEIVETATGGRVNGGSFCHADPWFKDGMCAFGQTGAAQGHLANNGVGPGDVFLFFGLFTEEETGERHHRIFGYMKVEEVLPLGSRPDAGLRPLFARDHPHFIGERDRNNTLYVGPGSTCIDARESLRLTQAGGPLSLWNIPAWLPARGLTYHAAPWRWPEAGKLVAVSRGQEFISHIGTDRDALMWVEHSIAEIHGQAMAYDETGS